MKVSEVAKMLNVSELTVRVGLQQGVFPFGVAFKRSENSKNYKYIIFDAKVIEYIGRKDS